MASKNKIVRSSSHKKEAQSKRNFEQAIADWNVNWSHQDYGADALVELTSKIKNSNDVSMEGQYFLVQLKSTDKVKHHSDYVSFVVQVKKIISWTGANVPFLLVLNDLVEGQFFYVWMDEVLVSELSSLNPGWLQQKSVSLRLPKANVLSDNFEEKVRSYVYAFRRPYKKVLDGGQFFDLKDKVKSHISDYDSICAKFCFQTINNSIQELNNNLEKSLYQIAVAGQSRAGKSSLVNALLQTEICPTGYFQTTGVPIQIIPDKDEYVQVHFLDGRKQKMPFEFNNIEEYASQTKNPDNQKKVSVVLVSVYHQRFQKGISIYDVPGLDDPDEEISTSTWAAVNKANAVLYVVDITPAEHGGFILNNQFKRNITELSCSLEKVFLVFNKADTISPEKLPLVKERVTIELKKLNLYDKINHRVYFISTNKDCNRQNFDSAEKLQDDIWDYIVQENKYGIIKLLFLIQEIVKSTVSFLEILQARLIDNKKRQAIIHAIQQVKLKVPELEKAYADRTRTFQRQQHIYLEQKKNDVLLNLEKWLKSIPLDGEFPNKTAIRQYLKDGLNKAVDDGNVELALFLKRQKDFLDSWIESNLQQVKEMLSQHAKQKIVDLEDLERLETPTADLSSAFGMSALAYVMAAVYMPALAVGAALLTFFGSLVLTVESRRAKRILQTIEKARVTYDATFDKLKLQYDEIIVDHSRTYEQYAGNKLRFYFQDLELQLSKLNIPLSSNEEKDIQGAAKDISTLRDELTYTQAEIMAYKV